MCYSGEVKLCVRGRAELEILSRCIAGVLDGYGERFSIYFLCS